MFSKSARWLFILTVLSHGAVGQTDAATPDYEVISAAYSGFAVAASSLSAILCVGAVVILLLAASEINLANSYRCHLMNAVNELARATIKSGVGDAARKAISEYSKSKEEFKPFVK